MSQPKIRDPNPKIDLIQGRIRDLWEKTDFAETIFEGLIGYAIIAADFDGNIIAYNKGAQQAYGYTPEEIIGKENIEVFFPKDFIETGKFQEIIDDLLKKETVSFEGEKLRKNSKRFPAQMLFTLTKDRNGKLVGFIEIAEDLTERKQAQEALELSKESFANVVEKSGDGIIVVNSESGIVHYVNPAAEAIFGSRKDGLVGELFGFTLTGGKSFDIDIIRNDGELGIGEMHVVDTKWEGQNAYLASVYDITEKKRDEERLHEYTAELERSNEEIKQFAYIVSHDLRAPLVNLKGFASELQFACHVLDDTMTDVLASLDDVQKRDVTRALKEDIPEALYFINSSVTRMDDYVNAILKLSRLGRRELNMRQVDMAEIVRETLCTLRHQIEKRNVKVTIGSLPEVIADRTSMEQVMDNLLTNALLYLDPERPGEIVITADGNHDEVTFRILDNGRGISKEDMKNVFAPFKRAGKEDVPGEGMGLAYVQTLIKRHRGRIWVESGPGEGATFFFSIPKSIIV